MLLRNSPVTRRRLMFYPIYVATALVCVYILSFLVTLNETREFIGERGIEYCWAYGSFSRYLFAHVTSICVALGILSVLYKLAKRNSLSAYLIVCGACMAGGFLISFLELNLC